MDITATMVIYGDLWTMWWRRMIVHASMDEWINGWIMMGGWGF